MVSLLLVSLYEFKQFLQIVLWIAVPLTLVAILLTTILHYRRKKRKAGAEPVLEKVGFHTVMAADDTELPDWLVSTQPGNDSLLKKYEKELRRSKENYIALEQDFSRLEEKYSDLLNKAYHTEKYGDDQVALLQQEIEEQKQVIASMKQAGQGKLEGEEIVTADGELEQLQATIQQLQEALRMEQEKREGHSAEILKLENLLKSMEQTGTSARAEATELQRYFAQQVEELGRQYQHEKDELTVQLQQSEQDGLKLAGEITAVKEQLHTAQIQQQEDHHQYKEQVEILQQSLLEAEEEKKQLKEKVTALEYLQDVVDEKKLQTDFLQNQLEQRIKSYHRLEQEAGEKSTQLQHLQSAMEGFDRQVQTLKEQLQQKQQETAEWQQAVEHNREETHHQQEALREKVSHIESLEYNLQELQQQQAALQSVIDDKQDAIMLLQQSITHEQQKAKELESKLELSSQLLVRIYSELAKSFSAGLMHLQNGSIPGFLNSSNNHLIELNEHPPVKEVEEVA